MCLRREDFNCSILERICDFLKSKLVLILIGLFPIQDISAQAFIDIGESIIPIDETPIYFKGKYDIAALGGSFRDKSNHIDPCSVTEFGDTRKITSIPDGATIVSAFLYWGATLNGGLFEEKFKTASPAEKNDPLGLIPVLSDEFENSNLDQNRNEKLFRDNQVFLNGHTISSSKEFLSWRDPGGILEEAEVFYSAFADVTDYINPELNGPYEVEGLTSYNGGYVCEKKSVFSGWQLYVVYKNEELDFNRIIKLYDGLSPTRYETQEFTLKNLQVPNTGRGSAILGTWEGDSQLDDNEEFFVNDQKVISSLFDNLSNVNINSDAMTLGVDVDRIEIPTEIIGGTKEVKISITTGQDLVLSQTLFLIVETYLDELTDQTNEDEILKICLPPNPLGQEMYPGNIVSDPFHGELLDDPNNANCITYIPNDNYFGLDSFTITACSPNNNCDTLVVYLSVISQEEEDVFSEADADCGFKAILNTQQSKQCNQIGSASIDVFGGIEPYTYTWSSGENSKSVSSLLPGDHKVKVQDAIGNTRSYSFRIGENQTFPKGSYLVNLGILPQTKENGLKPYGLVYDMVTNYNTPVIWVIEPNKLKEGTDFSYEGIEFKSGAFVISSEHRTNEVNQAILDWESKGVIGYTSEEPIIAPVYDIINGFSNTLIDFENADLIIPYFENAGIEPSEYSLGYPNDLDICTDIFALPHADPTWETHKNLIPFNKNHRGFIWSGCHAVSVLENLYDPDDPQNKMNFLSTSGLQCFNDSDCGNHVEERHNKIPEKPFTYSPVLGNHPIMQFMGDLIPSTENGSEQWYIPHTDGAWNSNTVRAITTADGEENREGAKLVFGYGFNDERNGMVMYEGGHTAHQQGTEQSDVAAQRAFLNFLLLSSTEKRLLVEYNSPRNFVTGQTEEISVTASRGTPPYTYEWSASCNGEFINQDSATTTFTLTSELENTACLLRCVVTDACSRRSIISIPINTFNDPNDGVQLDIALVDSTICTDNCNFELDLSIDGGYPPYNILWSTGDKTEDIKDLCVGSYSVTVSDSISCPVSASIIINTKELKLEILQEPRTYCDGDSVILTAISNIPSDFIWSTGDTSKSIIVYPSVSTSYSVMGVTIDSCLILDSILIVPTSSNTYIDQSDYSICEGDEVILSVRGNDIDSISWSTGEKSSTIYVSPSETSTYSAEIRYKNGCIKVLETEVRLDCPIDIVVEEKDTIHLEISKDTTELCLSINNTELAESIVSLSSCGIGTQSDLQINIITDTCINIITNIEGFNDYDTLCILVCTMNACDTLVVIINKESDELIGNPPVAITDSFETVQDLAIIVDVILNDIELDNDLISLDQILIYPLNGQLMINNSRVIEYIPGAEFTGIDSFMYKICDTDINGESPKDGCDSAWVYITVDKPICAIPQVITPNGDGRNDQFIISCEEYLSGNIELDIYNRWGNHIYSNNSYQNNWEGTYKNEASPDGTYYYTIRISNANETLLNTSGFIVIQR